MRKLLRILGLTIAWAVGGVVGLVLLIALGFLVAKPTETVRLFGQFAGKRPGHMQLVPGTPEQPLPKASFGEAALSIESLQAAMDYGAETGSDALIVWRAGRVQLEHYYEGADETTLTSTQSMHKSVVALLVGVAIAEGHIASADDRVSLYLPEWAEDERAGITIRQALWQSSGIDFPTFAFGSLGPMMGLLIGQDMRPTTMAQMAVEPPATNFEYNSINPLILGLVIEKATGRAYADYLSEALWKPLGAGDAWVQMDTAGGMARSYCCLDIPARGWLRLGLLHLENGRANGRQVVPGEWMAAVRTPGPQQSELRLSDLAGHRTRGTARLQLARDAARLPLRALRSRRRGVFRRFRRAARIYHSKRRHGDRAHRRTRHGLGRCPSPQHLARRASPKGDPIMKTGHLFASCGAAGSLEQRPPRSSRIPG